LTQRAERWPPWIKDWGIAGVIERRKQRDIEAAIKWLIFRAQGNELSIRYGIHKLLESRIFLYLVGQPSAVFKYD
jgi:hypothetical protein